MGSEGQIAKIIEVFFFITTSLSLVMVLAQFTRFSHWSVRMFDFPVKQMVLLQLITTVLFALTAAELYENLHSIFIGLSAFSLIILIKTIYPYTPFHQKDLKSSKNDVGINISCMSANVYQYNDDYELLLRSIEKEDPDSLLLLETDSKWAKAMSPLDDIYPHQLKHPLDNTYGLLFFSKYEMEEPEIRFLLKSEVPSIKTKLKLSDKLWVRFYGVHPEPPSPTESDTSEPRDIELLKLAKEVRKIDEPIILSGDFNDVAWSHTTRLFRRFSGLLDPRIGRGSFSTFHTKLPLLRWPLDHFFLSSHFTINEMKVLSSINSDHFPILIDVQIHDHVNHSTPRPELEDVTEVKDKLKKEEDHMNEKV